jgi:hypothetical protein
MRPWSADAWRTGRLAPCLSSPWAYGQIEAATPRLTHTVHR